MDIDNVKTELIEIIGLYFDEMKEGQIKKKPMTARMSVDIPFYKLQRLKIKCTEKNLTTNDLLQQLIDGYLSDKEN